MPSIKTLEVSQLSEQLLLQVKKQESTDQLRAELAQVNLQILTSALRFDIQKKAFWINIYNAFFQILRKEKKVGKPEIYRSKLIPLAGHHFSLDDIEHGILRKYRLKWGLGYLPNPFAPALIKPACCLRDRLSHSFCFKLWCQKLPTHRILHGRKTGSTIRIGNPFISGKEKQTLFLIKKKYILPACFNGLLVILAGGVAFEISCKKSWIST